MSSSTLAQLPRWTTEERADVDAGELAIRRHEERRGDLALVGGSSWRTINAPVSQAWLAVRDVARYQHMLPLVESARRISGDEHDGVYLMRHRQGPVRVAYHLRLQFDDSTRTMRFRLDDARENDLRAAWGYVHVQSWGSRGTLFSWGVMADFGSGVISGLMRPLVQRWMLRIPSTFKRYLEGWGRRNYPSS